MLVGTDVCVQMVFVWEENGVPGGNQPVWLGDHMTISHADAEYRSGSQWWEVRCVNTAPARQPIIIILKNSLMFSVFYRLIQSENRWKRCRQQKRRALSVMYLHDQKVLMERTISKRQTIQRQNKRYETDFTTGNIFITSLVWRGPWLGIKPGTSPSLEASTIPLGYRGGGTLWWYCVIPCL